MLCKLFEFDNDSITRYNMYKRILYSKTINE